MELYVLEVEEEANERIIVELKSWWNFIVQRFFRDYFVMQIQKIFEESF